MSLIKEVIGMPVEKATELLMAKNINVTVHDFSEPDKYHRDVKSSVRVVKAVIENASATLFVAGFDTEA